METDFNYLSGEKLLEYMSKNYATESHNFPSYAEKLILSRGQDLITTNTPLLNNTTDLKKTKPFKSEVSWSTNEHQSNVSKQTKSVFDETKMSGKLVNGSSTADFSPVSYGKLWEKAINQQLFINIINNWRKSVGFIFNDSYKDLKYTLNEGIELLQEGAVLNEKVSLPELKALVKAVDESIMFEEKIKKLLSVYNDPKVNLELPKSPCKITITELYELLKEGENCVFRSNYLDFLKSQLEKLKSWKSNVQSAIIEKNLDKCKDSIKDKDEILIEIPGVNDLTEQIAASNWIEKVERSLSRPMKLSLAENLLNEPAAKCLDEKSVVAKQQLINRVRKAQDWLNTVQSPPFVYSLVAACKITAPNDISEITQKIIDQAKAFMEDSLEWRLPKPNEFEKVWLESSSLKIVIPLMKYMEPVYLRWRKWNKKYKRLMDGLCIYMEAQLVLEEAEYTLCDYLDMSEYLPELQRKIEESGNWLHKSKEFLKKISDFHTKQDIDSVSSSIWTTIVGIKKGNGFSRLEIQRVLDFMGSQFQERLGYEELKQLIETGNELTIYEMTILQELISCQDGCEKWLKKGKEYLKCSKIAGTNTATVINLLLERSCILVSKEIEDSLFAELNFVLWEMDIDEVQAPINDYELNSLIERFNEIRQFIGFNETILTNNQNQVKIQSKKLTVEPFPNLKKVSEELNSEFNEDAIVRASSVCESNAKESGASYDPKNPEISIRELEIQQINVLHWSQLKELEATNFIRKLQYIQIYWTDLIHKYETEKRDIEIWRNILKDLKNLPILFNELESKINQIIVSYDRIVSILKLDKEIIYANDLDQHRLSLLYSYRGLCELNSEIHSLPVTIIEWERWKAHLDELNRCDEHTLSKFSYLKDAVIDTSSYEDIETKQTERKNVLNYLKNANEKLASKSVWGITDFSEILIDLKYTGKLIQDLSICESWIKDTQCDSSNDSMVIEYWTNLLQKGKAIRIIDSEIFNKFEIQVKQSIEWNEIYIKALSTHELSKVNKQKRNNKIQYNKILYQIAELLVGADYGIGERLITFRELKQNVKSFIELRAQSIEYLKICINERRNCNYSHLLNKYLNQSEDSNQQVSEVLNQIDSIKKFTNNLKVHLECCNSHPISMDLEIFIQDEILLREINEKMFDALIVKENPYFSTNSLLDSTSSATMTPTFIEANDLISFILESNLNTLPEITSNIDAVFDELRIKPQIQKGNQLTIEEINKTLLNTEFSLFKDLDSIEIQLEKKYIDIGLFEQFKKAVYLSNEWLRIFKIIYLDIDSLKTENFYNKQIPKSSFTYNVKSSIDNMIKECLQSEICEHMIDFLPQKGCIDNQLKFELNWRQILDQFDRLDVNDLTLPKSKHYYAIKELINTFEKDFTERESKFTRNLPCKTEKSSNELFCNDYSEYNIPLSMNLLHFLRNNKDALSHVNEKFYYEDLIDSVKSYIIDKYCHFTDVENFNIEQFKEYIYDFINYSHSRELEPHKNEVKPDSIVSTQCMKFKRNKRSKSIINEEKINEENIDAIIDLLRGIEMPTIELSLILINYGKKFIKFELKELSDLCLMVEISLMWMTLTVNKFPNLINTNLEDNLSRINEIEQKNNQNSQFISESWERSVSFNFFDINNHLIASLSTSEIPNSKYKDFQNTINLNEFISLIETCDQLPIQIPIKSRLVERLVDLFKWIISAKEAIMLLPKNTILCPWLHTEGLVKEINLQSKNSKIMKTISLERNNYCITDEEIVKVMSNLNTNQYEPALNSEKYIENNSQIKKLPRPRGRPKREQVDIMKIDTQFEDVFKNICINYNEFDQLPNCVFPKSFYLWLLDKNNEKDFNFKELLSIVSKDEDQEINKSNDSKSCNLKLGWYNGYYYWNENSESDSKKSVLEEHEKKRQPQYIGLIDPKNYPKKEIYKNKLLIDYILCIEVYISIQSNPELCSICSNFTKQKITNNASPSNESTYFIICDECSCWYHHDCVGYTSKSSNQPGRLSHTLNLECEFSPWICPSCSLRSETSHNRYTSIVNILKGSTNLELFHNNNAYVMSDIHCKSISPLENIKVSDFSLKREVPSLENLKQIMLNSFSKKISFIKLYERNLIANKLYLHNVWLHDFYRIFNWDPFELSDFNPLAFNHPSEMQELLISENQVLKEKCELLHGTEENENLLRKKQKECEQINSTNLKQTSRKGRLLKNKISAKEMLNPKLIHIKPKKGRKRRILFSNSVATKQIKRTFPCFVNNSTPTMQLNFEILFQNVDNESLLSIDLNQIGRVRVIETVSPKSLRIDEVLKLYFIAALIGLDGFVEIEWLYCILKYLIFFNSRFGNYNENLTLLKNFQISEDLSFISTIKNQKRISWEDFKYILVHFSPNFPIKLDTNKFFYSNLPKVRSLQLRCISILNYFKNTNQENFANTQSLENDNQTWPTDPEKTKLNGKSFKTEVELLLISVIKMGIIIPEENVIFHLLSTYYLESILLLYGRQISSIYCNQLNPKPLHSTLVNINQHILFWKESDTNLMRKYNTRFIPPEYYGLILENESLCFQNQEKKPLSRIQRFVKCCETIQDSINQCNEWNEKYKFLMETQSEFEIYVELLKQGLNLPCIYPTVYSFGNILASIESYEDFVNQVFDSPGSASSLAKSSNSSGSFNHSYTQSAGTILGSNQTSLNPKFENIQILKNVKEFLKSLPIQKNDLILKLDQMEENTQRFIEGIKQKMPQLKQLGSTEALISQLQLIKEEAIHKVPIIVNNITELRELLNNIPDFGSPHHNLLLRTQFLMSLQCPIAKLRKPLNPFPNIPEVSPSLPNIVGQNQTNELYQPENKGELTDSQENNSNKPILHALGGASNKFNTSCQLPSSMSFIWQNLVQQGSNPMSHYYYK